MYRVEFVHAVEKQLSKLPHKQQQRITAAVVGLREDPYSGKKLSGKYRDYYSLRVWPYRVIYTVQQQKLLVLIIRIGHRQGVYR